MNPDVYRGLWGGSKCRDSPVQADRSCDCEEHCAAADHYYNQLEEVFKYSLPRGKVGALFAESIQVYITSYWKIKVYMFLFILSKT